MPGPFDSTTKYLVQTYPRDWLALLGLYVAGAVDLLDAELTTVSPLADKIIRLHEPAPRIVHLEFQSTYDRTMGQRLAEYNILLHGRHSLPVRSVLVLLRPSADGPALGGVLEWEAPDLTFRYQTARLWQQPVEALLGGPLGTLPLAPLADAPPAALPGVLHRLVERVDHEAPPAEGASLKIVTFTLLGLRFPPNVAEQLMPGIRNMRDSSTYQMILDEGRAEGEARGRAEGRAEGEARGRAEEARRMLVLFGVGRLGPPEARTLAALEAIGDPAQLEPLGQRLLVVASWDELLAAP